MRNLIDISDLDHNMIREIWERVGQPKSREHEGSVAWSFEGNGIRTRTTFLQAFRNLGIDTIELPNVLKTQESVGEIAGYLDSYYSLGTSD